MDVVFTTSAGRHGYTLEDALHAIQTPIHFKREFQRSRTPEHSDPDLYVGPAEDGTIIEVLLEVLSDAAVVVFHVMPARKTTLNALLGDRRRKR
jgi:hypothetical protein